MDLERVKDLKRRFDLVEEALSGLSSHDCFGILGGVIGFILRCGAEGDCRGGGSAGVLDAIADLIQKYRVPDPHAMLVPMNVVADLEAVVQGRYRLNKDEMVGRSYVVPLPKER